MIWQVVTLSRSKAALLLGNTPGHDFRMNVPCRRRAETMKTEGLLTIGRSQFVLQ